MNGTVELQTEGRVAWLTLNHPERHNALTADSIEQLIGHLEALRSDPDVRVLVLTGAGDRTFCSGMSLPQVQAGEIDPGTFESLARCLAEFPLPKIAALNGDAYGGGAELGICCDLRLGVEGMKIRVPAARFGLCYPASGIQRFVEELGLSAARRILAFAETVDARELLHIGYLHGVCDAPELAGQARDMAERIAGLAPLAVSAMRELCRGAATGALDPARARDWAERCNRSGDLAEGLAAALEKREPRFRGK
ncbi:MAG: enoyl-CoA hydratase/isomerase family protein [Gammaproteobacteria bacterium]|nr:enoyl-CoA hydratase/isomerase family protein [Gammaproteobacteria bacterium]NNK33553.1 enoyl-CoA hydratase/isomerase family protein [Xanthomonadales bacterium]